MARIRLRMTNPRDVRRTLVRVANMVINGELDPKVVNSITGIANSILGSVRVDEQQRQIEELAEIMETVINAEEEKNKR